MLISRRPQVGQAPSYRPIGPDMESPIQLTGTGRSKEAPKPKARFGGLRVMMHVLHALLQPTAFINNQPPGFKTPLLLRIGCCLVRYVERGVL